MVSYPSKGEKKQSNASHGGKHYGKAYGDFSGAGHGFALKVRKGLLVLVHCRPLI
jgi:hypothetical protein